MSLLIAGSQARIDATYFDDKNLVCSSEVFYPDGDPNGYLMNIRAQATTSDTPTTLQAKTKEGTYAMYNAKRWADTLGYQACRMTVLDKKNAGKYYICLLDMCDTTGLIRWEIFMTMKTDQSEFDAAVATAYAAATATKPESTMKSAVAALRALL